MKNRSKSEQPTLFPTSESSEPEALDSGGVVGFTGTQRGLTPPQRDQLAHWLQRLAPCEVHHGDCVGADAQFHALVRDLLPTTRIVLHPPRIEKKRAFCQGDEERPARAYLTRNHAIVRAGAALLAAPGEQREKLRSGTWATVRYARQQNRPVILVLPQLLPESMLSG